MLFFLTLQLLLAILSLILWQRMRSESHRLKTYLSQEPHHSQFLPILISKLQQHWDDILFSEVGSTGFLAMQIRCREQHDNYHTVEELLTYVVELSQKEPLSAKENLIKALYQLQNTTKLPEHFFQACLQPVHNELQYLDFMGKKVGRITQIRCGDLIDPKMMWPINHGLRVRQPLGVVIYNLEGKIISKAKVLCT
jgi:hypothetical protein